MDDGCVASHAVPTLHSIVFATVLTGDASFSIYVTALIYSLALSTPPRPLSCRLPNLSIPGVPSPPRPPNSPGGSYHRALGGGIGVVVTRTSESPRSLHVATYLSRHIRVRYDRVS